MLQFLLIYFLKEKIIKNKKDIPIPMVNKPGTNLDNFTLLASFIEIVGDFGLETLVFLERQPVFCNLKEENYPQNLSINNWEIFLKQKDLQYETILENTKFKILIIKRNFEPVNLFFKERTNILFGMQLLRKNYSSMERNNSCLYEATSMCQCLNNMAELVIILNRKGIILDFNKNVLKFFGISFSQNISNLNQLFHVLRQNQILPEAMQDLSYTDLVNNIMMEKEVILLTLEDKYYSFQTKKRDYNNYVLFVTEVTKQLNTKMDLQNNYQLINYLLQSMEEPMVVFNRNKLIEFTNRTAEEMFGPEMLDHAISIKTFVDTLQKYFSLERVRSEEDNKGNKHKLYFKHREEEYEISTRIIGDFTCLLMEKVKGNSLLQEAMFNKQNNIQNTINLLQIMQSGEANAVSETRQKVINKISNNIKKDVEKVNDYLQIFHCEDKPYESMQSFLIPQLVDSLNGSWVHRKNICIKNQITESFAISAHQQVIQKILEWIVDDLDFLCEEILLEFKTLKEHICIQIKLLKQHPSLLEYKNNLLESVKEVYTKIIQKNHGLFNIISNQNETAIQIILAHGAIQNNTNQTQTVI